MSTRQQRLDDFLHSQIMGISVSQDSLEAAQACLATGFNDKKINLNFPNGNHFTKWAIPASILFTNAFEIFLNEIVSYFHFEEIISLEEKANIAASSVFKKLQRIQNLLNLPTQNVTTAQLVELKLALELRNDLIHYFPRIKFTDNVNSELDKKGLLIPNNVAGRKHASYLLSKWVAETIIKVVKTLGDDIAHYFLLVGKSRSLAASGLEVLKANFTETKLPT